MPELTVLHYALLGLVFIVGVGAGWYARADRCAKEKIAVNASWQDQLESQQSEHNRITEQNKSLMEQISQYQASQKDYANRAKELSESLKEAFARRDELQRQLKDARGNLEVAIAQRDKLAKKQQDPAARTAALKEKDDKIFNLSRELTSWQSRVPPLVERFQEKSKEAAALEEELDKVRTRLQALEDLVSSDETHIEPVDAESLPDGGAASNEPIAVTSAHDTSEIQDQIEEQEDEIVAVEEFAEPVDPDDDDIIEDREFGAVFSDEESDDRISGDESIVEEAADDSFGDVFAEDPPGNPSSGDDNVHPIAGAATRDHDDFDDLRKIKGIGPAIERTLNELGIYRYHQIAEMSEYDIDRVAQQLKGFRSRIYREDWIGQARDLQYEKSNSRS